MSTINPDPLALAPPLDRLQLRLLQTLYPLPAHPPPPRSSSKPMAVLCLGLPRTGTESLALALEILDIAPVYHGWNNNNNNNNKDPSNCATWNSFASFKRENGDGKMIPREHFEQILSGAVAVADFPATAFSKDLAEVYPEAKIVLN
ncbi:Uu.00g114200.m01.CDS01 [Anthostomella pinea]|uniref:Uu.00g114200.m01.CDS01 n=1 Tax=Anthostomella pinea TaxID=933095 RepID=A0AAI8VG47_9PEZI|nr:Uu.00g114200.m01.CDS01 [Anthostomella pinea]